MKKQIPKAQKANKENLVRPSNTDCAKKPDGILFSFEALESNEYFNLDMTCPNWAAELFRVLKSVSKYNVKDIYGGQYTDSTIRVHSHRNAHKPPCNLPRGISLEEMWQIRISQRKGGIHGIFIENVFYVIWFDPLHNLYPDERFGGLKKIKPPGTCCRDREEEVLQLKEEIKKIKEENQAYEELLELK